MYQRQHLQSAITVCNLYRGEMPFAAFIKQFFKTRRQYGSRDRKVITHLCYCGFRTGKSMVEAPVEERIVTGLLLCSTGPDDLLEALRPGWLQLSAQPLAVRMADCGIASEAVFPFANALSNSTDAGAFQDSFFSQPKLFLRLRPGHETAVINHLQAAGLTPEIIHSNCIALPGSTSVDALVKLNTEAVVQDYNSQQTAVIMQRAFELAPAQPAVWDCCAASGGKSILMFDLQPDIQLTVSDIRASVLANLRSRFAAAGIHRYRGFTADITATTVDAGAYNLVVADVPCTGSGTWARTPEQLFYFEPQQITDYAMRQRKILENLAASLKPGALLIYITCSVFAQENEMQVAWLCEKHSMELNCMQLLPGYDMQADTMFAALLRKKAG